MKISFITLTVLLIYIMRFKNPYKQTYDPQVDNFAYWKYLIPPCIILGIIFSDEYDLWDILWTFSIFLEATTIIPQLQMLHKIKEIENMTSNYVVCLGLYRALYIVHWVSRY
jgi:ER lumen protein retaining receptor